MSLRTHGDFGEVVIVEGKVMNVQAVPVSSGTYRWLYSDVSPRSPQTAKGEGLAAWASERLKSEGNEVIVFLRQACAIGTVSFCESLLILIAYL